jgi:hypothetical protein
MNRAAAFSVAIGALVIFAALSVWSAVENAPTNDETTHLTSGYVALRQLDFRSNPEHPPLAKMFAAVPLLFMDVWPDDRAAEGRRAAAEWKRSWDRVFSDPTEQWRLAWLFLFGRKDAALDAEDDPVMSDAEIVHAQSEFLNDSRAMFIAARLPIILLGLAGGAFVFLWSRELWGLGGAAASTVLYAFDPSIIAHSAVVTTDVALATLAVATLYFFWRAMDRATAGRIASFAIAFGVAMTVKFNGILLVPIIFILALFRWRERKRAAMLIVVAGVSSIAIIWAAYGFRFSAAVDGSAYFHTENVIRWWQVKHDLEELGPSATKSQEQWVRENANVNGSRALVQFAWRHHLLPEAYLHGIAYTGATTLLRSSFLNGEYSHWGFASYFFWTWLYKTPIPLLILTIAGVLVAWRQLPHGAVYLVVPAIFFFVAASSSGFNVGHRHVLVVLPFVYILCGSLGAMRRPASHWAIAIALLAVSSSVVFAGRPALMFGNHLAYLNEIAGGPRRGYIRINDSNFDWGQDLGRLGDWYRRNRITEPIALAYFGNADPRVYGIPFVGADPYAEPRPGLLAISTAELIGLVTPDDRDRWRQYLKRGNARLIGRAGYSILIYRTN